MGAPVASHSPTHMQGPCHHHAALALSREAWRQLTAGELCLEAVGGQTGLRMLQGTELRLTLLPGGDWHQKS